MEDDRLLEIQGTFFYLIKEKNFGNLKLADQVATILDITLSSAYKKIRCETVLTSRDYMLLAAAFGVSLDSLVMDRETDFLVRRPHFITDIDGLKKYLVDTANELERLSNVPHEFYYAARDLPVFLFFSDPVLIRFKIAVWLSELDSDKPFSYYYRFLPSDIMDACNKFYQGYKRLNRWEIWSMQTLVNLYKQIEYYETIGQLSAADCSEISQSVIRLMDNISDEMSANTESGYAWRIYEVDFLMMASNGLVLTPFRNVAYISYAGINYLRIDENHFCHDLQHWFKKQIANSTALLDSKKAKVLFFQRLKKPFLDRLES